MGLFSFLSGKSGQAKDAQPEIKLKPNPFRDQPERALEETNGYLEAFANGGICYTRKLMTEAKLIIKDLYPRRSLPSFDEAAETFYMNECARVDQKIWIPLTGKSLLELVKESFDAEGIHNHSPEALQKNAMHFATRIQAGDTENLTLLLFYRLKADTQFVNNLTTAIFLAGFNQERFFHIKYKDKPTEPRVLIHEKRRYIENDENED